MNPRQLWSRRTLLRRVSMGAAGAALAGPALSLLDRWSQPARPRYVYIGAAQSIYVFDARGPRWRVVQQIPSASPAALALHPAGRFLYVAHAVDSFEGLPRGAVSAYSIDPASGGLTHLNRQPLSLSATHPRALAVSPAGDALAVAAYGGGAYNLLPIAPDGSLGRPSAILKLTGAGPDPLRQRSSHPHSVIYDPAGRFLVGSDLGADRLHLIAPRNGRLSFAAQRGNQVPNGRDSSRAADLTKLQEHEGVSGHDFSRADAALKKVEQGALAPGGWSSEDSDLHLASHSAAIPPGSGPASLALHPNGQWLYAMNELGGSVALHAYHAGRAGLSTSLQSVAVEPATGHRSQVLQMHPAGHTLYAAAAEQGIAAFRIDPASGRLSPAQRLRSVARAVVSMGILSADALLIADCAGNRIVRLDLDPQTGAMRSAATVAQLPAPLSIAPGAPSPVPTTRFCPAPPSSPAPQGS